MGKADIFGNVAAFYLKKVMDDFFIWAESRFFPVMCQIEILLGLITWFLPIITKQSIILIICCIILGWVKIVYGLIGWYIYKAYIKR